MPVFPQIFLDQNQRGDARFEFRLLSGLGDRTYQMTMNLRKVLSMKLSRDLKNAFHLTHRNRETFISSGKMFETVEVNEIYIGGLEKNKHKSGKQNAGWGGFGTVTVIGVKKRESKKIKAGVF